MPTGNPKPQTVASKKYQDKVGWISKSYKLKKEVVESCTLMPARRQVSARQDS